MDSTIKLLLSILILAIFITKSFGYPNTQVINAYENQKLPDVPGYIPVYIKAEPPPASLKSQPVKTKPSKKKEVIKPQHESGSPHKTNIHKKEDIKQHRSRLSRSSYVDQHHRPTENFQQPRPDYGQRPQEQYRPDYNKPNGHYEQKPDYNHKPNEQYRPDNQRPHEQHRPEHNRPDYNRPDDHNRPDYNRPNGHHEHRPEQNRPDYNRPSGHHEHRPDQNRPDYNRPSGLHEQRPDYNNPNRPFDQQRPGSTNGNYSPQRPGYGK